MSLPRGRRTPRPIAPASAATPPSMTSHAAPLTTGSAPSPRTRAMPAPKPPHRRPSRSGSRPPCTTRRRARADREMREQLDAAVDRLGDTVVSPVVLGHGSQSIQRCGLDVGKPEAGGHVGRIGGIALTFGGRPREPFGPPRDSPPPEGAHQQQSRPRLAVAVAGETQTPLDVVPDHLHVGRLAERPDPADRCLGEPRHRYAARSGSGAPASMSASTATRNAASVGEPSPIN